MRRHSAALVSLVGLLALGACTGRDSTAPRGIAPDLSNAAAQPPGPATTCDFSATKAAFRNYFTSTQDPAFDTLSAMQKAYGAGDMLAATKFGYAIGRIVARERLTSKTTTASAGAIAVLDVLQCMSDVSGGVAPYPKLAVPDSFTAHAAGVLGSGIWEVRGGTTNSQFPAAGRVIDNTSHLRAFGLPRWGAEPKDTVAGWPGATEYVVFGYPATPGTLIVGSPSNININEVPASAFELGTIPDATSKAGIRVGVCLSTDNQTSGSVNRIVHNNTEILNTSFLTQLCDYSNTNFVASASAPAGWYVAALQKAANVLAPRKAYAQFSDCADCIGGLPSGWSPFSANSITATSIRLAFVLAPNDTAVSQTDTAIVKAAIGSTPVPGVVITMAITGNSGTSGGATFDNGLTYEQATTGADGTVTFIYKLQKAGGYTLTTSGTIDTFPVGNTLTTTLNIQNK